MFKKIKKYLNVSKALVVYKYILDNQRLLRLINLKLIDLNDRKIVLLANQIAEGNRILNCRSIPRDLYYSYELAIRTINLLIYAQKDIAGCLETINAGHNIELERLGWDTI